MKFEKINSEIKNEWIKRLRSGNFKQGVGVLKNSIDNKYCCLGVLCEIHPEVKFMKKENSILYYYKNKNISEYVTLPKDFREKIGMDELTVRHVAELNDAGYSFNEIADWIEKNL